MPNRGEFRATTDQMMDIIDKLRALEVDKRAVALGTPEFVRLAVATEEQARLAFRWAQLQHQMAVESAARIARGEQASDIHLVEVIPRPVDRLLADWREAQLRLEIARPGSAEAEAAANQIERLREEYQLAFAQVGPEGLAAHPADRLTSSGLVDGETAT